MNVAGFLPPELLDAATAIGLVDAGGNLDADWFNRPLFYLESVLSNASQRAALLDLFDLLLPPQTASGAPSGEKWHPLLGQQPNGNLYLTVENADPLAVGLAGNYNVLANPAVSLSCHLPLVSVSESSFSVVAGTANGPLQVELEVALGWTRPAKPIALSGIQLSVSLAPLETSPPPPPVAASLTLQGLDLDGKGAADCTLSPSDLGQEGVKLILGLIWAELEQLLGGAGAEVKALAAHLPALLGLDGTLPPFPIASLATDPKALASWFTELTAGSTPPILEWLGHLAGLLGVTATATATGAAGAWTIPLITLGTGSTANLTVTLGKAADGVTPQLGFGIALTLPAGAAAPVRLDATATLLTVPLAGSLPPAAIPSVNLVLTAPGQAGQKLVSPTGGFGVDSLRAGFTLVGETLTPLLQLTNVSLPGVTNPYPVIDLTDANTIVSAATSAASAELTAALGATGAGLHLAALIGLLEPALDPTAPLVDLTQLLTHPTAALATLYRNALLSSAHPWKNYFNELVQLLGLPGSITGSGTTVAPWQFTLASSGALSASLAAWNAQTSGNASDPQQLRIALQLSASVLQAQAVWNTELLSADLVTTGANNVRLLGGHHLTVSFTPGSIPSVAGFDLQAGTMTASLDLIPGQPPQWQAEIDGLVLGTPAGALYPGPIKFPLPSGFDVTNPTALGVSASELEQLALAFLTRELSQVFGPLGLASAVLFGAAAGAPGLQDDFPQLSDPSGAGSLYLDLVAALKAWLAKVATGISADGTQFISALVPWLAAWLGSNLPDGFDLEPDAPKGSGTYADPWQLPLGGSTNLSGLVWLEPNGPPSVASAVATALNAAQDFDSLASALAMAAPYLGTQLSVDLSAGLSSLSSYLISSDGVVPTGAQQPSGWTAGSSLITSAHPVLPGDSSAITQILAQVDAWAAPGGNRAILLLGPAFNDATAWKALLAAAESAHAGSTNAGADFNLRVAGVLPAKIDLRPVTAVADYYTVELQDDGSGDIAGLTAQISLVIARILELKPGTALILVAHSTAGIAATQYVAANASQLKGLITLGTPHAGSPLTPLTDPATAEALRAIFALLPAGVAPGPLQDALTHLRYGLDGYLPNTAAGSLPTPFPYPYSDFSTTSGTSTGAVPALALVGQLGGSAGVNLLAELQAAAAAAVAAYVPTAPTHISFGASMALPLGADGSVATLATLRCDLGRLPLAAAADPPRPAHAFSVDIELSQPGGWLVGGPVSFAGLGNAPVDVRVRRARLGVSISLSTGGLVGSPYAELTDAAWHGPTLAAVHWGDAQLPASLGSIFSAFAAAPPAVGSSLATLLAALQALGLCAVDTTGAVCLAADALTGLQADAIGFFKAQLSAALSSNAIPGFSAAAGGFSCQPAGAPFALGVQLSPPTLTLSPGTGSGIALGPNASLALTVSLPLATMQPAIGANLSLGSIALNYSAGSLTLAIPPALPSLQLYPAPGVSAALAAVNSALPWLLVEVAGSSVLQSLVGPNSTVGGLVRFFLTPGASLVQASALGDGQVLDPAKINALLQLLPALPAGLSLSATGKNPTTISISTTAPIGGILGLSLGVVVDTTRHLAPAGTVTLQLPLPGTWASTSITFGISPSGISLSVQPAGAASIELLPTFSGSAALAATAQKLLPAALDGLVGALPAANPLLKLSLSVATALDLYDSTGGFAAHASQWSALLGPGWMSAVGAAARTGFVNAAVALFNDASSPLKGLLPGTFAASGSTLSWSFPLPAGIGAGNLTLTAGWDSSGPTVLVGATGVTLTGAPLSFSASAGYGNSGLALDVSVDISLAALGIIPPPRLEFGLSGSSVTLALLPLGAGTASTLSLQLLPSVSLVHPENAGQLASAWGVPLAADLLITATGAGFSQTLWSGGPTIQKVLQSAGIITTGNALASPLPTAMKCLGGLVQALTPVTIPVTSSLSLTFHDNAGTLGIGLLGTIQLVSGSPTVSLLLGKPADWLGSNAGVTFDLFNVSGSAPVFAPALTVRGLGVGLTGDGDAPLLNTSGFRLGGVDAYLAFTLDFEKGTVGGLGGGLEIDQIGLPLNQLSGSSSSNPVAASLFDSNGGSGQGTTAPTNPGLSVTAYFLDGNFTLAFTGQTTLVIPIHASLGPIYIQQIDVSVSNGNQVALGVDGSVKINGLEVDVDDLALAIPVSSPTDPSTWSLDLQGLAVSFDSGAVQITGGLTKNPGPPIEYDGMLSAMIAGLGLTIVGAYSRPSDAQGGYTSLFLFVSLPLPLGGPPFAFVMGLGGGFGYNRELDIPQDITTIPTFLLVSAINDSSLSNDPMNELVQMGTAMPARRGAYWMAAGVLFTSFSLVNSTVVVAVTLDGGFEIDVLGVSRMALPTESLALASVELALKARYNSEEGVLQIQAQLTDNSYLFTRDCRLTGGFAFFVWFNQGQFVLTLGGYNPVFAKPAEFPDVPRLGFDFSVGGAIEVKGGSYFALTNSCVMAGASLGVTATFGPASAWFTAYLDVLISWDPFEYEFDIGIEVGASLSTTICFIGCCTIGISLSFGAQLQIQGPPFHGTATLDLDITTITVSFGDNPQPPNYITDWGTFAAKYITAGDPNGLPISLQVTQGLLPPDPPGASPQPGTQSAPWQMGVEFAFSSTTRMPAVTTQDFVIQTTAGAPSGSAMPQLDVAPMDEINVGSLHSLALDQQQPDASWATATLNDGTDHFIVTPVIGYFPEATWHWVDPTNIPAGARTISALAGLSVQGVVVFNNQSALIPISTLVDDLPQFALPLPFAVAVVSTSQLQSLGADAAALAAAVAAASTQKMLEASAGILSGNNIFSQQRSAFGLPPGGLSPLAQMSLSQARSSPPLVMPMTAGLTMKPVGLPAPTKVETIPPVAPVLLAAPRLRATAQRRAAVVADAAPAQRTSVASVAAARSAVRATAPVAATLSAARLLLVPALSAPRSTRAAAPPRMLRHAAGGSGISPTAQQAFDAAATAFAAAGVTLAAGAVHVWQLPRAGGQITLQGSGAARVVFAARNGAPLADTEMQVTANVPVPVPAGAALAIVESLGVLPAGSSSPAPGLAAVTAQFAPPGAAAAVGWQFGNTLVQAGPTWLLARGATVRLARNLATRTLGRPASYGAIAASLALAGQIGSETRLPAGIGVVIIALDQAGASLDTSSGDLALAVTGATLATPPLRVAGPNRRLLLYDVATRDSNAATITIAVASTVAWAVAGVIGVPGVAANWAAKLADGLPAEFVPEGPLTPEGSITVAWNPPAQGAAA